MHLIIALLSPIDTDFVTWRGHLTKLLTTPYENREGWLLAVSKFKGTLYVSEVETEAARTERQSRTEKHKEMMYWGYKFEQYMCAGRTVSSAAPSQTTFILCDEFQTKDSWLNDAAFPRLLDNAQSLPNPGGVVNTNEAFCSVVRTRLADHRLLFSGEVDGRDKDPRAPPPPECYIELKTSAEICTPKQHSNFHR